MSIWDTIKGAAGLGRKDIKAEAPDAARYQWGGSPEERASFDGRVGAEGQAAAQNRSAPQLDWSQADQSRNQAMNARGQQQDLADRYGAISRGEAGASLAEQQLRMGQAQAQQQALSAAAATRGGGGASLYAQQQAQQNGAMNALAVNRDAAMVRSQEQQQAMAAQGAMVSSMRQGDQSQQGQDVSRQGLVSQNELSQRGMNDAQSNALLSAEMHAKDTQLNADMAYDQSRTGLSQQANLANQAAYQQQQAGIRDYWKTAAKYATGGAAGGAGAAAGG